MKLEFTEQSPLRLEAFSQHYAHQFRAGHVFQTQAEAESKGRRGSWVCLVKLFNVPLFYTCISIQWIGAESGMVIGQWNELTLLFHH